MADDNASDVAPSVAVLQARLRQRLAQSLSLLSAAGEDVIGSVPPDQPLVSTSRLGKLTYTPDEPNTHASRHPALRIAGQAADDAMCA